MDHETDWKRVVDRLRADESVVVSQAEIGMTATPDDFKVIGLLDKALPPSPITQFYTLTNGVTIRWSGTVNGQAVQGSVNILPIVVAAMRAPAQEEGEPLEGILWNDEFAPGVLKQLKRMTIFEHLAGRSAFLTYLADESDAGLFLVDNDDIQPIVPDFAATMTLLQRYAGADWLREHLTNADWRQRIDKDVVLQAIAAL